MSNFGKSLNNCGRSINYPHFGDIRYYSPQNVLQGLVPPPGVDVNDSVCKKYYETKDFNYATPDCKECIYNQYSNDRECSCVLNSTNLKDLCDFAKCVTNEYKKPIPKCQLAYYSLFNEDDVNDENYLMPFSYNNLKNCN